jgi:hypothetical protein
MTSLATTLRQGRDAYLEANGFSTAAYSDRWVHFRFGPFYLLFPSTKSRRAAIPFHDLHHVLTGYQATPLGEAEIGAWEIATGLHRFWSGWVLDLFALGYGVAIAPHRTYRAFIRGRHSRNLYGADYTDELLDTGLDEMREKLHLKEDHEATAADKRAFAFWLAASAANYAAHALLVLIPLALLVWWIWLRG